MNTTKLLVSCGTLGSGGAERVLSILSKGFADAYGSVEYLMWVENDVFYQIDPRVKITSLEEISGKRGRLRELPAFRRYVSESKPDVVLSFLTPFSLLVLCALWGKKTKVIVAERNAPHYIKGGKLMEWIRDLLFRRAAGVLVQTKESSTGYHSFLRKKITTIYNPLFMPSDEVGSAVTHPKQNLLVSVGRLSPQKDQLTMIKAFKKFQTSHPDYQLIIYGEGECREQIEKAIQEAGLSEGVSLPGANSRVWDKMKPARAFVLSSIAEGLSNAMLEALCMGLPVVSTAVPGANEFIVDGQNGYLVPIGDAEALAERLCLVIDDGIASEQLSSSAHQLAAQLNEQEISNQWITYINSILKDTNAA